MSHLRSGAGRDDAYEDTEATFADLTPDVTVEMHEYWQVQEDRDKYSSPIAEIPYRPKKETDTRGI